MADTELLDLFSACHERIRRTLRGLAALSTEEGRHDPRAPATAVACARYLRVGLPLHAQDEDLSLAPRLRELLELDPATLELLDELEDEHDAIETEMPAVLAPLDAIAAGQPALVLPERLDALLQAHLKKEESEIFPWVRQLPIEAQEAIIRELRHRRTDP